MPEPSETTDYLYSLRERGSQYGLQRMQRFVAALGNPHKQFPLIHVAGTNGKGSVCAMLETLYQNNGYKTGLFTSPHLVHLGERVQVNRCPLTMEDIDRYTSRLRTVAEDLDEETPGSHPTFFEFMAAMAFLHFAESKVNIALIETGLGGRLDATNIVDPELSIITTISLDHTEMLGETLTEIAGEKAGIVKPKKPILIGHLPPEAQTVVRRIAAERSSPLLKLEKRFPTREDLPETNLFGAFQRINAGLALQATEILSKSFPIRSIQAFRHVDWPGRWQKLEISKRTLILDATHNPEGAQQLTDSLSSLNNKPIVVAGTLGEERGRHLMQAIAPYAREVYLVEPNQPRALPATYLQNCLPAESTFPIHASQVEALFSQDECKIGEPGDTIVCTGSIYLIGEILQRLQGSQPDTKGNLQDRVADFKKSQP
ncbi:MAG: bifunctional folylpolyglutamate synthase/dihydrofolate synthase [Coraliomargaritaceae bacterium]